MDIIDLKKSVINISNTVRSDSISNKKKKIYASSDSEQIQAEFFTEFSLDLEFDRSFTNIAININIHTEIETIKARLFHSGNVKTKRGTTFSHVFKIFLGTAMVDPCVVTNA